MCAVFGRSKSPQTQAVTPEQAAREGAKGRPTPSRREAEARNKRPIVAPARSSAVKANMTKEERKAAKVAQREAMAADRRVRQAGFMSGDERYLPARDKGPVKRYVRDYVDARRNAGEYVLPVMFAVLVVTMLVRSPVLVTAVSAVVYGVFAVFLLDSYLLNRRLRRLTTEKFGAEQAAGAGWYGVKRAFQMRRMRMPKPQVGRGQRPS